MKLTELLDLTLRELLENYVVLYNYECCYPYGVAPIEVADKMYEEYDVKSYWEAMTTEPLIDYELLADHCDEVIDMDKVAIICDNLGIKRKDEQV